MKKVTFIFVFISSFTKDSVFLPKYLYIVEVYEYVYTPPKYQGEGYGENSFNKIGIIETGKNGNKIKTLIGKKYLENMDKLLVIDFSKCRLDYLQYMENGMPLLIENLEFLKY